jgi:hypothetical protein
MHADSMPEVDQSLISPKDVLHSFRGKNRGEVPRIIVLFRDGVSEGEFDNVARHEQEAMEGNTNHLLKALL